MRVWKAMRLFRWLKSLGTVETRSYPQTIDEIIEAYPKLYSQQRFSEWRKLFDEKAVICRTGPDGKTWVVDIEQSSKNQETFANKKRTFCEKWENVRIHSYGNIALIAADYILEADSDVRKGKDILLLMRGYDGWRIVGLVYDEQRISTTKL
jgi:hypothetical protein